MPAEGDYLTGVQIVRGALSEPLHLIAGNAGYDGDDVVSRVRGLGATRGSTRWTDASGISSASA